MKRLPVYAVLLLLLGGLVFVGGMAFVPESVTSDPASITRYDAEFVVDEGGDLHATETITVRFPSFPERHGIFRFFDHRDANAEFSRRKPHDISVTRAGSPEEFELLSEADGRYTNVKIGSAYRTVRDEQVYVIRYVMDDVLLPVDGGERSRFYWDLIPAGWQMDITRARLRVTLPTAPDEAVSCYRGVGQRGGCTAQVQDDTITVEVGDLADHTPVTVDTMLAMPAPEPESRQLWPTRLDGVFGQSTVVAVLILLLGLGAAVLGYRMSHSTREKDPAFPLMYAPPDGLGPAQGAYVLKERVNSTGFVASLMQAAERGVIDFDRQGDTWTIGPTEKASVETLDEITATAVGALSADRAPFTASPGNVGDGKRLKAAIERFEADTKGWAARQGVMTINGLGSVGGMLWVGAVALTGYLAFMNPLGAALWAIVPGLFVVFGFEVLLPGSSTRRTPQGRELWSKVGGFRRVLATPSAEARFDFSGRKELYTAYLPWAVAFGVADEWAKKYRVEVGEEPPAPSYWAGSYGGVHTGTYVSQMVDSFDSTVDSAISSYQATQRSSSSGGGGGGGGFGGGGGGGGGGGSW